MKKIVVAILAVLMVVSIAACSNKVSYDFDLKEYITLPTYTGIEVKSSDIKSNYESKKTSLIDNATKDVEIETEAEKDNTVTAKITATLDGTAVASGSDEATALKIGDEVAVTIGANYFGIEEFDTEFIGKKKGDEFKFEYTFAEDYEKEILRGKKAEYTVNVTKVTKKDVPEYTDALVEEASGYKTIAEYEAYVNREYVRSTVWNKVVSDTEVKKYPMDIVKRYYNNSYKYYDSYATAYGTTLSSLVSSSFGMTMEDFLDNLITQSKNQVLQEMVYTEISKTENIVVDEEYYTAHVEKFATDSGYESVEALEAAQAKETIESAMLYDRVIEFIADSAVTVD